MRIGVFPVTHQLDRIIIKKSSVGVANYRNWDKSLFKAAKCKPEKESGLQNCGTQRPIF